MVDMDNVPTGAEGNKTVDKPTTTIVQIPTSKIVKFRWSTGIRDEEIYKQLKTNIKEHGIHNPVLVRPVDGGKFEPYAGDHRVMIAKELKHSTVPCIVRDIGVDKALELCLSDNICRQKLSCIELEDKVTQLWQSGRYESYSKLGKKIGMSGNRVGQLVSTKEIRDQSEGTLNEKIPTQAILDSVPLENDQDRIALLKLVREEKIKTSEIKSKARVLSKISKEAREAVLYHGKDFETVKQEAKTIEKEIPKENVKPKTLPTQNKNLVPETYKFLKGLGNYIATMEDEKQKNQAMDYVKVSTALLLRILKQEQIIIERTFETIVRNKLQIDPKIIDSFDGQTTKGVEWYF